MRACKIILYIVTLQYTCIAEQIGPVVGLFFILSIFAIRCLTIVGFHWESCGIYITLQIHVCDVQMYSWQSPLPIGSKILRPIISLIASASFYLRISLLGIGYIIDAYILADRSMPIPEGPYKHIISCRHRFLGIYAIDTDERFCLFPTSKFRSVLFSTSGAHTNEKLRKSKLQNRRSRNNIRPLKLTYPELLERFVDRYTTTTTTNTTNTTNTTINESSKDIEESDTTKPCTIKNESDLDIVESSTVSEARKDIKKSQTQNTAASTTKDDKNINNSTKDMNNNTREDTNDDEPIEEIIDVNAELFFPIPNGNPFTQDRTYNATRRYLPSYIHPYQVYEQARFSKIKYFPFDFLSRSVQSLAKKPKSQYQKIRSIFYKSMIAFYKYFSLPIQKQYYITKNQTNGYFYEIPYTKLEYKSEEIGKYIEHQKYLQEILEKQPQPKDCSVDQLSELNPQNQLSPYRAQGPDYRSHMPQVLFCHGIAGSSEIYSIFARAISSYGFIVVAPTFTDRTSSLALSFSQIVSYFSQPLRKLPYFPYTLLNDNVQVVYGKKEIDSIPERSSVAYYDPLTVPSLYSSLLDDYEQRHIQLCRRVNESLFILDILRLADSVNWVYDAQIQQPYNSPLRPLDSSFPPILNKQNKSNSKYILCAQYQQLPSILLSKKKNPIQTIHEKLFYPNFIPTLRDLLRDNNDINDCDYTPPTITKFKYKPGTYNNNSTTYIQPWWISSFFSSTRSFWSVQRNNTSNTKSPSSLRYQQDEYEYEKERLPIYLPSSTIQRQCCKQPYRIDWERLGLTGHSFGGATVYHQSQRCRTQFRSCLAYDPWMYPQSVHIQEGKVPVTTLPTCTLSSQTWYEWKDNNTVVNSILEKLFINDYNVHVNIPSTYHSNFSDTPYWSPKLMQAMQQAGPQDVEIARKQIARISGLFLLRFVSNAKVNHAQQSWHCCSQQTSKYILRNLFHSPNTHFQILLYNDDTTTTDDIEKIIDKIIQCQEKTAKILPQQLQGHRWRYIADRAFEEMLSCSYVEQQMIRKNSTNDTECSTIT